MDLTSQLAGRPGLAMVERVGAPRIGPQHDLASPVFTDGTAKALQGLAAAEEPAADIRHCSILPTA